MMKDEIRAQKERVKQMSRWERFKYFWYYQWKWVALAGHRFSLLPWIYDLQKFL